jgi:hypothetical protein
LCKEFSFDGRYQPSATFSLTDCHHMSMCEYKVDGIDRRATCAIAGAASVAVFASSGQCPAGADLRSRVTFDLF